LRGICRKRKPERWQEKNKDSVTQRIQVKGGSRDFREMENGTRALERGGKGRQVLRGTSTRHHFQRGERRGKSKSTLWQREGGYRLKRKFFKEKKVASVQPNSSLYFCRGPFEKKKTQNRGRKAGNAEVVLKEKVGDYRSSFRLHFIKGGK